MTAQEFQARRVERISDSFASFIGSTSADKLDWTPDLYPESAGRTILSMVDEVIKVNIRIANLLASGQPDTGAPSNGENPVPFESVEAMQQAVVESGKLLASRVRMMTEADLSREFPHWVKQLSGEVLIEAAYRNMAYHAGQINYIQLLLGDAEFHAPSTWR